MTITDSEHPGQHFDTVTGNWVGDSTNDEVSEPPGSPLGEAPGGIEAPQGPSSDGGSLTDELEAVKAELTSWANGIETRLGSLEVGLHAALLASQPSPVASTEAEEAPKAEEAPTASPTPSEAPSNESGTAPSGSDASLDYATRENGV